MRIIGGAGVLLEERLGTQRWLWWRGPQLDEARARWGARARSLEGPVAASELARWTRSRPELGARVRAHVAREWGPWAGRGAVEGALRRGSLVVVEVRVALSEGGHARIFELELPASPVPATDDTPIDEGPGLAQAAPPPTQLRVLDRWHRPVEALTLALPSTPEAASDMGGGVALGSDEQGACSASLVTVEDARWAPEPAEDEAPEDAPEGIAVQTRTLRLSGASWEPEAAVALHLAQMNWLVLERPVVERLVPAQARSDHGSGLSVPGPWTQLEGEDNPRHPLAPFVHGLRRLLDEPGARLLVVGHASADGGAKANQALSEARAAGFRHLLEGAREAWVELARDHGSLRDVVAYLDYLGTRRAWTCVCEAPVAELSAKPSAASKATVSAFQSDYNQRFEAGEALAVDGVCGEKTLGAVFDVLRDELARWLDKLGTHLDALPRERIVYLGHGAELAGQSKDGEASAHDDEAGDRAVEFLLYWGLAADVDEGLDALAIYTSPVLRWREWALPDEPDEWATGPFTIVSDLTPEEPALPETYRLEGDDGLLIERVLPDEGVVEAGELTLHYEALPTHLRYTLTVIAHSGNESVIFEGLRYGQLHSSAL